MSINSFHSKELDTLLGLEVELIEKIDARNTECDVETCKEMASVIYAIVLPATRAKEGLLLCREHEAYLLANSD